jgi:hypothetical protein
MNRPMDADHPEVRQLIQPADELGIALALIGGEHGSAVLVPQDDASAIASRIAQRTDVEGVFALAAPCPAAIAEGVIVAFVLTRDFLDSDAFANVCIEEDVDVASVREAFRRFTVGSSAEAHRLLRSFELLIERTAEAIDAECAADSLADSLGTAFERADVTLTLAAAMHAPTDPGAFIAGACEELRQALQLDWAGLLFNARDTLPRLLRVTPDFAVAPGRGSREAERAATAVLAGACLDEGPSVGAFAPPFAQSAGVALIQPLEVNRVPVGALVAGRYDADLMSIDSYHLTLAESVCAFLGPFIDNLRLREQEQRAFFATLEALSSTLDAKDSYTRGHSERVAHLAVCIAEQMRLERVDLERLEIAGRLHDVGKIGVPEAVLLKPGGLTDDEFELIKRHPTIGYEILRGVPGVEPMLPAVLHHHERWDGRGYPAGLAGENIPLDARIMAVADTFDAMSSKRSYRDSLPRDVVCEEIARSRGSQLDADVVDAFLGVDLSTYDDLAARSAARDTADHASAIASDAASRDDDAEDAAETRRAA